MSTAETYHFQAGNYQGGNLWREPEVDSRPSVLLGRSRSTILRGLKTTCYVVRDNFKPESIPEEVPVALDGLFCFLEANIDDYRYEAVVDRVGKGILAAKIGAELGIVSVRGDMPGTLNHRDLFPVPEVNNSPVVTGLRSWFAEHKFSMAVNANAQNLHEINLMLGMPTDDEVYQNRVVLRVMEASTREILDSRSPNERRAGKVLGYREFPDYSRPRL